MGFIEAILGKFFDVVEDGSGEFGFNLVAFLQLCINFSRWAATTLVFHSWRRRMSPSRRTQRVFERLVELF